MSIAEASFTDRGTALPVGVAVIMIDVGMHPGTSIGDIVARTGLPQSHVSTTIARSRERGLVTTRPDPADGRRTLVTPTDRFRAMTRKRGSASINDVLLNALGPDQPGEPTALEVVAALEIAAARLRPRGANVREPAGVNVD
jgi:DNA-binding MarR family transcriptional regulator